MPRPQTMPNLAGLSDQPNQQQEDRRDRSESLSAPRMPRISYSEPPEELALLDLDEMTLPPMDPVAKPSVHRYSLHFLMTNVDALPPIAEWHPRTLEDGRLRLSPMRDRPLHAPLQPGTPTRAQALLALRDSGQGFAPDFLARTGFVIPAEIDPDIPSRRESNLSHSDAPDLDDEDMEWGITSHGGAGGGAGGGFRGKLSTLDEESLGKALANIGEGSRDESSMGEQDVLAGFETAPSQASIGADVQSQMWEGSTRGGRGGGGYGDGGGLSWTHVAIGMAAAGTVGWVLGRMR